MREPRIPVPCLCGATPIVYHRSGFPRSPWAIRCPNHITGIGKRTNRGCISMRMHSGTTRNHAIRRWNSEAKVNAALVAAGARPSAIIDVDSESSAKAIELLGGLKQCVCGCRGEHVCLHGDPWRSPEGRGADEFGPHAEKWKDKKPRKWRILHRVSGKCTV